MAEEPELIVERQDGLAILRLNRPERLNALSAGLLHSLAAEVPRLLDAPEVRALLITGTGKAFCAGGDVESMTGRADKEAILAGMRSYHPWLRALRGSDKLVITAVNGAAAGGGFGLALIGDLIVASDDAYFKCAFTSLGAAPDYGLGFSLPRAVGEIRAAEILFNDRRISAREALELGMVTKVLPSAGFAEEALAFAQNIARLPRGAQLTKRLLRQSEAAEFARYLEVEADTQTEAFQSQDFAEGVKAFREKRKAEFRGR